MRRSRLVPRASLEAKRQVDLMRIDKRLLPPGLGTSNEAIVTVQSIARRASRPTASESLTTLSTTFLVAFAKRAIISDFNPFAAGS